MDTITILYGSETGNSEDFAEYLGKRLQYYGLRPTISSADAFPLKNLVTSTKYLVVISSTTGQGELPRNIRKFFKFLLKKKLPSDFLDHIHLTTFGIGDLSYTKFNYAIRKIHLRLTQLGCKSLSPRAEADELSPEGVDGFYKQWEQELIDELHKHFSMTQYDDEKVLLPVNRVTIDTDAPDISYAIAAPNLIQSYDQKNDVDEDDVLNTGVESTLPNFVEAPINTVAPNLIESLDETIDTTKSDKEESPIEPTFPDLSITRNSETTSIGRIVRNERVTATDHFQDIRHIVLESKDLNALNFQPGDSALIYPVNEDRNVELLLQLQPHWQEVADKPLTISGEFDLPGGVIDLKKLTLRSLIKHHFDIMSIPKRSIFLTLWHFVNTDSEDGLREQEKLKEFSSFDEPEELYNYANRPRRSLLETIMEFDKNLRIPISYVFDLIPKIKPRYFSIASKPSESTFELVIGVVEYKTMLRRIRRGLCSTWIKGLVPGDEVIFSIDHTKIKFEEKVPLILICAGTGIAPMRSVIQDKITNDQSIHLFYGCRYKEKDFLFEQEWEEYKSGGLKLYPTFSRQDKVKYVQDKLFEEREVVSKLILEENAGIFVCGSAGSMPKQVKLTLIEITRNGKMDTDQATEYIAEMEENGRYIEDVW